MDGQRFDELARAFAGGFSRRRTMKVLVSGIAGALAVSRRGDADAAAYCRSAGQICRKPGDCCSNFCGPTDNTGRRKCDICPGGGTPCGQTCCSGDQTCLNGACCSNPCGEGSEAVCCATGQSCISTFIDQQVGFEYSCCAPELACNDFTECCSGGAECIQGGCCAPENICNTETCCTDGSVCTEDEGCCSAEFVCEFEGSSFCCGVDGQCDAQGCLTVCEISSCSTSEDCGSLSQVCCDGCCIVAECCVDFDCVDGESCCNGACVDTDFDPENCSACDELCAYSGDPQSGLLGLCCSGICDTTFITDGPNPNLCID